VPGPLLNFMDTVAINEVQWIPFHMIEELKSFTKQVPLNSKLILKKLNLWTILPHSRMQRSVLMMLVRHCFAHSLPFRPVRRVVATDVCRRVPIMSTVSFNSNLKENDTNPPKETTAPHPQ
jgi:hypothetical protein